MYCPKCLDTYCTCGHVWLDFSVEILVEIRNSIQKVIDLKQQPKADENIIHKKSDLPDSGYISSDRTLYPTTQEIVNKSIEIIDEIEQKSINDINKQ